MARRYPGLDVNSDHGGLFPWQSRLVDVGDDVHQAVVDEGPRDAPVTFLLLHGNPTWGFLYRRFIAPLAASYRVVVPDHVGFGRSDKPRDPSYYSLERHITNLEALARVLDLRRVVLVMHDWGGPIGMGWATRNPERVAGFVVLNTWAFVRDPPMRLPWFFKFLVHGRGGWRRTTRRNLFVERFLPRLTGRKLLPAEMDAYRAPFPAPEDRVGMARSAPMIPETHRPDHESWATMAAIEDAASSLREKPALIVWALKDVAFRKATLDRWVGLFDHVDGPHRLPEAKHYLQEDASEEILAHMQRWAKERWPKARTRRGVTSRGGGPVAPRPSEPSRPVEARRRGARRP